MKMSERIAKQSISMSGFGGGYEQACQDMLKAATDWFEEKNIPREDWAKYGNDNMKELEKVILKAAGGDSSGAMFGAVKGHLGWISKNGYENWIEEGERRDQLLR